MVQGVFFSMSLGGGAKLAHKSEGICMISTETWAKSFGISAEAIPPEVKEYSTPYTRSAQEIAVRAVILQGVVAVASGVNPEPVADWFRDYRIWSSVTPKEQAFLENPSTAEQQRTMLRWHQEAEWTLLWAAGKVEFLGLPTNTNICDTRRLCDEIMPPLGSDPAEFFASVKLRSPGVLLAEDDRTYNLWCYAHLARRKGTPLPDDLNIVVLYERRYAFEWLDGIEEWDSVTCDA
jgi:hypothetical protein